MQRLDEVDTGKITPAQRAYLEAFDNYLRSPSEGRTLERRRRLDAACAEAGISPRGTPEQAKPGAISMTEQRTTPRTTKVVLADALREREARLAKLANELGEVRAAIKALEKMLPQAKPKPESQRNVVRVLTPRSVGAAESAGDSDALVLRAITEHQPVKAGELARRTELGPATLRATLTRLRDTGAVRMVGQKAAARYCLAEHIDRTEASAA